MMIMICDPDQIAIYCLHDPFPLRCPLCSGDRWERDDRGGTCKKCGLGVEVTQDLKGGRLVLEVLAS